MKPTIQAHPGKPPIGSKGVGSTPPRGTPRSGTVTGSKGGKGGKDSGSTGKGGGSGTKGDGGKGGGRK